MKDKQISNIDIHFDVYIKNDFFYITNDYDDCVLKLNKEQALELIRLLAKAFITYKDEK